MQGQNISFIKLSIFIKLQSCDMSSSSLSNEWGMKILVHNTCQDKDDVS